MLGTDGKRASLNGKRGVSPNDPKLSDRGVRRGTCMVGGKVAVEAGAVTCGAVRCSAWLGALVVIGVGVEDVGCLVAAESRGLQDVRWSVDQNALDAVANLVVGKSLGKQDERDEESGLMLPIDEVKADSVAAKNCGVG